MKDLEKNVNYDLSKCSDEQLKQICEWLVDNDKGWHKVHLDSLKNKKIKSIAYMKNIDCFMNTEYKKHNNTVCATTLFDTHDNLDTLIVDTMRKFRVLGYEIDIVIKNKI